MKNTLLISKVVFEKIKDELALIQAHLELLGNPVDYEPAVLRIRQGFCRIRASSDEDISSSLLAGGAYVIENDVCDEICDALELFEQQNLNRSLFEDDSIWRDNLMAYKNFAKKALIEFEKCKENNSYPVLLQVRLLKKLGTGNVQRVAGRYNTI